jgi:hypothetical protein
MPMYTMYSAYRHLSLYKYFRVLMACLGRNLSPLFKLIKYKIVVFDEVYILFHFNIILKINTMGILLYQKCSKCVILNNCTYTF